MWNGTMFVDLDWPLNASSLLSASAELLVKTYRCFLFTLAVRSSYSTTLPPRILLGTFPLMSPPTKILVGIRPRHPRRGWRLWASTTHNSGNMHVYKVSATSDDIVQHVPVFWAWMSHHFQQANKYKTKHSTIAYITRQDALSTTRNLGEYN